MKWQKNIAVIIPAIMLVMLPAMRSVIPWVALWANQQYYAEVLCENKDKPEMHCNGACHARKVIAEPSNEDSEAGHQLPPLVEIEEIIFVQAEQPMLNVPETVITKQRSPEIHIHYHEPASEIPVPPPWKIS